MNITGGSGHQYDLWRPNKNFGDNWRYPFYGGKRRGASTVCVWRGPQHSGDRRRRGLGTKRRDLRFLTDASATRALRTSRAPLSALPFWTPPKHGPAVIDRSADVRERGPYPVARGRRHGTASVGVITPSSPGANLRPRAGGWGCPDITGTVCEPPGAY